MDANHFFITKKFEEEMNNLLKSTKEKQPSKKRVNPFGRSISKKLFCQRFFQKKGCATKRFFKGHWFVSCQKQPTHLICGEYLAQMFGYTSLSKIELHV